MSSHNPSACLPHSGIEVTPEQLQIVEHLQAHPVTVVSAGAGAGKTYTTVAAVAELIASGQAQADEFVLITFTNQAADELRSRLQQQLVHQVGMAPNPGRHEFWSEQRERISASFIGTIHGFCKQTLDLYGYGQGVAREASVSMSRKLRKASVEALTMDLLRAVSGDPVAALVLDERWPEYALREFLEEMLADARNRGVDLGEILDATRRQADDTGKIVRARFAELLVAIERHYEDSCQQQQQLDAAALLLKAAELLASDHGAGVVARIAQRFRYLFIDEFQDTSATQARIASALATHLTTVVVGDRKQAIYAFAGANQSLLLRFAERHGTKPLPLRLSGRPSRRLLEVQNALFRSMHANFPDLDDPLLQSERNLEPDDGLPPCVVLLASQDEQELAVRAIARIAGLLGRPMERPTKSDAPPVIEPGDIAVLVWTNDEVGDWVEALNAGGIPARSDGGTPLLQRHAIVAMYRFLQLLARYPDDVTLVEALATPHFEGVDLASEEARILSYGILRGTPLTDAFEGRYPERATRLHELRTAALTATVPQLLGRVEECFDLKNRYRGAGDEGSALALDRLRDYARSRFENDQALTLRTFLEMLRRDILTGIELPEPASLGNGRLAHLRVMTIHRAKGLEFPIVVIPNLAADRQGSGQPRFLMDPQHGLEVNVRTSSGWTASKQFWDQRDAARARALAEVMRLFYVAVTRAERTVLMLGQEEAPAGGQVGGTTAHSWQREVLQAREAMKAHGALFSRLVRPTSANLD